MLKTKQKSIRIAFAVSLLFIQTSCSPLLVRYDSEDTKQMHKNMIKAQKEAERVKAEYRRLWEIWNECEDVSGRLQQALHECQRAKQ